MYSTIIRLKIERNIIKTEFVNVVYILKCVQVQSGIQIHFVGGVAKKSRQSVALVIITGTHIGVTYGASVNLRFFFFTTFLIIPPSCMWAIRHFSLMNILIGGGKDGDKGK